MKRGRHDECRACLFGLQPDCDSVIIFCTDAVEDYSLTSTKETYSADSAEFRKVMGILSRCTYHRSFRMLMRANNIEDNHAGFCSMFIWATAMTAWISPAAARARSSSMGLHGASV